MKRFFLSFFLIIFIIIFSAGIYLSFFGVETNKFDNLIKNKANEINQNVKLEFQTTKIHLNLSELNLVVKLQNPKILIKENKIDLSKLDLFLHLRSFFTSDFLLKRAEVAFARNDIKDLTKVTNIFLPKFINKRLKKIFSKGNLEGEFIIPFEKDGKIGKGYGFSGKVSDSTINLPGDYSFKNLTTEIKHTIGIDSDIFNIIIKKGNIYDLQLANSTINIQRKRNLIKINSELATDGKFNFSQIKKISKLYNLKLSNFIDLSGEANLKTNIIFDLDKKFKIKNLKYSTNGKINYFEITTKESDAVKEFLPNLNPKLIIKDTNLKISNLKTGHSVALEGFIKVNNSFDNFKIKEIYDKKKNFFNIDGSIDLTNTEFIIPQLNFTKDIGKKSDIVFNISFNPSKFYNFKKLILSSEKSKISAANIKLNSNFEIDDLEKIEIKTFSNKVKNNDFLIVKKNKILIKGDVFDAHPLLKSLYKKNDRKIFSKKFSSNIKIDFKKALTGTNDDVSNFAMIANIKKGSYSKLSLKGNFSENEIIEVSIYHIDKEKKTLQVISDRARPFIKNFNFVKGFEGGKLEYESIITKDKTQSNLLITDFKVSKVPALAKLLTLASLQGIADTLSGEGIRFDSLEMKSNSKDNLLNIEDALAMGPAISILLEGYVDKGKTVSLRGTLVPATKLNSIIATIPVVGEILVGKKTGEGVVGVSFKMKGPPKNIKTTVNPIKTLTPRFIVRAVEKIKKQKKD